MATESRLVSEEAASALDFLSGDVKAEWDFGDGSKETELITPGRPFVDFETRYRGIDSELVQSHAYKKPGNYLLTLTVRDERHGRAGSSARRVIVEAPAVPPTEAAPPTEAESAPEPETAWALVESPESRIYDRLGNQIHVYTITKESLSSRYRQFLNDEVTADWDFTFAYGLLPGLLVPGQSVTLTVSGSTTCEGDHPYATEQTFIFFYRVFGSSRVDLTPAEPIVINCKPEGNQSDSGLYILDVPNGKPGDRLTLVGKPPDSRSSGFIGYLDQISQKLVDSDPPSVFWRHGPLRVNTPLSSFSLTFYRLISRAAGIKRLLPLKSIDRAEYLCQGRIPGGPVVFYSRVVIGWRGGTSAKKSYYSRWRDYFGVDRGGLR